MGINEDNYLSQGKKSYIFDQPILLDTLKGLKITKVFAGSMTSMFITDRNELYACGINDGYQCGVEKKY
jgi:alpha-tubulin suppressor-like RCC1 family protein